MAVVSFVTVLLIVITHLVLICLLYKYRLR